MAEDIFRFERSIPANDLASVWLRIYRQNRYLKRLSDDELSDRLADVSQNMLVFDHITGNCRPNIYIDPFKIYRPVRNLDWMKMAVDIYEEFNLRGLSIPEIPSLASVHSCARELWVCNWAKRTDLIELSTPALDTYQIPKVLFRYSKKKYNSDLIKFGLLRVSPASSYNQIELGRAFRDNEKIMEVESAAGHFEVDDFNVACFSSIYSYRMFCEFKSNSCVVIRDVGEFQKRFNKAVENWNKNSNKLRIAEVYTSPIIYFDPLNVKPPIYPYEIHLAKPFRFAYQHEYRIVLLPTKVQPLKHFDLELGSLHDIAELVHDDQQAHE